MKQDKGLSETEVHDKLMEEIKACMEKVEIPKALDEHVKQSIKIGMNQNRRVMKMKNWMIKAGASAAIITLGFVGTANLSPAFAESLSDVPVLSKLVEVVTFRQFNHDEANYNAKIETPVIKGLENTTLEESLNQKYLDENKALYQQFETEMAAFKAAGQDAHIGVDAGFEVKTNTDNILSIARYVDNIQASTTTTMKYDTIDKQNEVLITLPSLFKDDQYITAISENIKEQMRARMAEDQNACYWIAEESEMGEGFSQIAADQAFYITNEGKLVIAFDECDVAPSYMGAVTFEIPTEVLGDTLVSNQYIK